jgi:asparagine synthase (glutamine-hydrolysing)
MCGILGYTHRSLSLDSGVLAAGLKALRHRGPDQQGSFESSSVSLGATRLRIVDLAGGDQPLHSADGDATIVFNGEIFNHRALRRELEMQGVRFRTHCDTEVVLQAWLRWGVDCFARLRGMFAVALWSEREQRLVLARDRMGVKPLYYAARDGELSFGSEMKCLFANPKIPRAIDLTGLNCYLRLNYVPGPFTLVEGIAKLMPGCMIDWRKGELAIRSYLPEPAQLPAPATLDEACEELDGLMKKAVGEQIDCDVPFGLWLSGGLDSSSVLHYAAEASSRPLKTFSVTFHGKSFDESRYIRDVAAQYGTEHTEFDMAPDAELADTIAGLSYYSDEPSADAGAVPMWYLSKMTRQHVTAVLSGEGADELFGGYLTYKADRYHRALAHVPRLFKRAALGCAQWLPASDEKIGFEYKVKRFLEGSMMSPEDAHVFWNGTFTEAEKRRFFCYADERPLRSILNHMRPGNALERYLDFDQRYSMPDGILYKVDRMSMAHAVEVRPPFLDDRIVDFAARLPQRFKMTGQETKLVLRKLMSARLPQSVLRRPKVGFDIPIHEWFRGPLRPLLEETLCESAVNATGLFEWPAIARMQREHQNRQANWGYHLWGLMTLLLWMKRWKIETPHSMSAATVHEDQPVHAGSRLVWQPAQSPVLPAN